MQTCSVLDLHSPEDHEPGDDQCFSLGARSRIDPGLASFVLEPAKYGKASGMYVPGLRNADFDASKDAGNFKDCFVVHVRVAKIKFEPAENRCGFPILEVLPRESSLAAAEHGDSVKRSIGLAGLVHDALAERFGSGFTSVYAS